MVYDVDHVVCCRLLLVEGNPKKKSQGRRISLPNTMLAGIAPVFSWVDGLLARSKMGSLSS
jgi:hypothetical protein